MKLGPQQLFCRSVLVDSVPSEGQSLSVEATCEERDALAAINGLVSISSLYGRFRITPVRSGAVRVVGSVQARVTQTCTISLDPFEADLGEAVDVTFMSEKAIEAWIKEHQLKMEDPQSPDDEDPPDSIVEGRVDLGVLTAEFLALGLDPYPRKPGAVFDPGTSTDEQDPSPFAVLAKLKREL